MLKLETFSACEGMNVLAGVGVLTTPYALKEAGWIGVLYLCLLSIICFYTGILLRRCLESESGLATYPDIGQAAFGQNGRILISVSHNPEFAVIVSWKLALLPVRSQPSCQRTAKMLASKHFECCCISRFCTLSAHCQRLEADI